MNKVYWILRKDLLRFLSDRNGALMVVLLPVVLASFMGTIFSNEANSENMNLLVVDQDGGRETRAFVDAISQEPTINVEEVEESEARKRVQSGDAAVALIIPEGTSESLVPLGLFGGASIEGALLFDPSKETEAEILGGLLIKIQMQTLTKGLNDPKVLGGLFQSMKDAGPPADIDPASALLWLQFINAGAGLADAQSISTNAPDQGLAPPLNIVKTSVTGATANDNYNAYAHNFSGMLSMFLMFMAVQMATNLINERKDGSLARVRMSHISPATLLLGTGAATSLVALVASAIVYLVGFIVFDISVEGSWIGFFSMLIMTSIFAGAFAILLAGFGKTEKQITTFGTFAVLILSFAGGAMIPSFFMPEWIQTSAKALPNTWITAGLASATWRGLPLLDTMTAASIVGGFSLILAAIGIKRFQWD